LSYLENGNIVIIGGGTAGWLTALYAESAVSKFGYNIIVIESSEIGILGAGEGTTPVFMSMLEAINISPYEIIKECGGTVKSGINFINWSDHNFFNPFLSNEFCEPDFFYSNNNVFHEKYTDYSFLYGKVENLKNSEFLFPDRLSEKNLAPVGYRIVGNGLADTGVSSTFESFSNWALHFDAKKIATFLKQKGLNRNIEVIDAKVSTIESDENGFIKAININQHKSIACDFVFDCTGFSRLIIGNHFDSNWVSHKDRLPVNRAMPFFQDIGDDIETHTKSIAMSSGWVWKIPTQDRYGCGYVFDSNVITDQQAADEVRSVFCKNFEPNKFFNFDAGVFDEVWIKNCMATGLAANFIEPLEATSIMQLILQLKRFFSDPLNIRCRNQKVINKFNRMYREDTEEIVDFIQLHYITPRDDYEFWSNFRSTQTVSEFLEEILSISLFRQPNYDDFDKRNIFKLKSYLPILYGLNLVAKDAIHNTLSIIDNSKYIEFLNIKKNHEIFEKMCIFHIDFLKEIHRRF
jgi:tryptophan 7-halogenase